MRECSLNNIAVVCRRFVYRFACAAFLLAPATQLAAQDISSPTVAVLQPADGSYLNSLTMITGTADDDVLVSSVQVGIKRVSDDYFWDGAAFVASETWLAASIVSTVPVTWNYSTVPAWVNGSTYTVYARAMDSSANWSVVYSTSMFYYGGSAPAAVLSLAAYPSGSPNAVLLRWNSPGDNGGSSPLPAGSEYRIQYSTLALGSISWSTATAQVVLSTSGVAPGGQVSTTVALGLNESYYFSLWTVDDDGNWSARSSTAAAFNSPFSLETVYSVGDAGAYSSMAAGRDGTLHVATREDGNYGIKYFKRTGSAWSAPAVMDNSLAMLGGVSAALAPDGLPSIAYGDTNNGSLKCSRFNGSSWVITTVDDDLGLPNGGMTPGISMAIDAAGNPHIAYNYDNNDGAGTISALKYAVFDGVAWSTYTIESNAGAPNLNMPSIALDARGRPHIAYAYGGLKYAVFDGVAWSTASLDMGSNKGWESSIVVAGDGNPRISYHNYTPGDTKYAVFNGVSWSTFTIDSTYGYKTSLALDGGGNPHVSYYAPLSALKDLRYASSDGSSWRVSVLDTLGDVGNHTSLALDAAGDVHISYYDGTGKDLKAAHLTGAGLPPPMSGNSRGLVQAPDNFKASAVYTTSVTWAWSDNSSNESGFRLYGGTSPAGPFSLVAGTETISAGQTSFTENGLTTNMAYYRYAAAINAGGAAISSITVATPFVPTLPTISISTPANYAYVSALTAISGTASDDVAVATVTIALIRQSDGSFWNGAAWAPGQTWLGVSLFPSSWTYSNIPALVDGSTYAVFARAMDSSGTWSTDSASIFYKDATGCYFPLASVQSGAWSAAGTWSRGILPSACSDVVVSAGNTVTVNTLAARARRTDINGSLVFSRAASTELILAKGDMNVNPGGTLDLGTEASPIPAAVTAKLVLSSGTYAGQYGLIVNDGGNFTVRGATKTPYSYAVQGIPLFQDYLNVYGSTSTQGWNPGDTITIGPTSVTGAGSTSERSVFIITGGPLYSVYWSGATLSQARTLAPETPIVVTNLTRNVLVRSSGTNVGANSAYIQNLARNATSFSLVHGEFAYLGANAAGKYGITFDGALAKGMISSSTIRNGYDGVRLNGSSNNSIVRNALYANSRHGVSSADSAANTFLGNNSCANTSAGFYFSGSSNNSVTGNISCSNLGAGIWLDGSSNNNTSAGNNAFSNATYGVHYNGSSNNTLTAGNIYRNGSYGVYLSSSFGNGLAGNNVYGNSASGIRLLLSTGTVIAGTNVFLNGAGLYVQDSPGNTFADGRIGYNAAGASLGNTSGEIDFAPGTEGMPERLILKGARVNPAVAVSTAGMDVPGASIISYNQDTDTGTVRIWGSYRLAGSTLTLDYAQQLYASSNTVPKLMRGAGHSVTNVVTYDAATLSELITVKHAGGNSWTVTGSSSGALGAFTLGAAGAYDFVSGKVDFRLTAGGALDAGDMLDLVTTAASNDAGRQKKLLFGPAAPAFNRGRSKFEADPTGGVVLRGKDDGTANTLVDRFNSGSTYYTFVDSGSFTAAYSSFANMDPGGIQLSGSAGVAISSCSFDYLGFASGTNAYITARDLSAAADIHGVFFGLSRSSAGYASAYNVRVEGSSDGLDLHFYGDRAALGPLWGEPYDSDAAAANRVKWGDAIEPDIVVLQPQDGAYLSSLPLVHGTAFDDISLASVTVSLKRGPDGYYWDGAGWAAGQAWLAAEVLPSSWTYSNIPAFVDASSYTLIARALDTWGNWSAVYSTSVFVFDDGLPVSSVTVPAAGAFVTTFTAVSGTAWDAASAPAQVWVKVRRIEDGLYWNGAISQWTAPAAWNLAAGTAAWSYTGLPQAELTSWTSYYAVARAADLTGNIQASEAWGSTFTFVVPPELPGAASAPSGSVLGFSSIAWSWAAVDGATGYNVYSVTAPASLMSSPSAAAYVQQGLIPNTTYSIMAVGVNFSGEGPMSPASGALRTLAAPPAAVSVWAVYITSATLTWELNGNPAGVPARMQRVSGPTYETAGLSYTDTGLISCTSYYFRVWNVNGDGVSSQYSEVGPAFTGSPSPLPPGNLSARALAGGSIALSWEPAPYEGITGYNLYYDNGTGVIDYAAPLASLSSSQTSYTTGVLASSAAYKFGLRAAHRCGVEDQNTGLTAAAPSLSSPAGVSAAVKIPQSGKRVNGNSVTVMAEPVTGAVPEILNVRLQYKASASGTWLDIPARDPASHPNPDYTWPYFIHWDVTGLAAGGYDLRAVAAGLGGTADPFPAAVTIAIGAVDADITENSSGGRVTKQQVVNNLVANTLQAADSVSAQVTTLEIPAGALDHSTSTVAVTNNPSAAPPAPADAEASGIITEVTLAGQSALAGGQTAVVTLLFPDADNNGIVDGTNMRASRLEMYSARTAAGPWQRDLSSVVDVAGKKVTGRTTHFSFFALFAPLAANINLARAYPVPWKPGSAGRFDSALGADGIIFDNLAADTEIRIFTITGQLVRMLTVTAADLGFKVWDGKNSSGAEVVSGVYLAHVKSGSSTKLIKIAVER